MKIFILLLLFSTLAYADDDQMILNGGLGVFHSGEKSLSETKMTSLGVQETLFGPIKDRGTVGGWLDNAGDGRKSSAFVAGQIGFEVNSNGLVGGVFTGPAIISSPDAYLGGVVQFMDDIHLGIEDRDQNYIGVMYRHLSSAGIEVPNEGRDFMGLELRMPF